MDDLVAANIYHTKNSPTVRSMQRRQMMSLVPVMFIATFILANALPHSPGISYPLIVAAVCASWTAGYLIYYYKHGYIKRMRKMLAKLYSEGKSPSMLGEHVLEVDENGFTDRTKVNESRYSWGALQRIESEPGRTYLYVGAVNAFVIPHSAITEGNLAALLEQVKIHYRPDAALTA